MKKSNLMACLIFLAALTTAYPSFAIISTKNTTPTPDKTATNAQQVETLTLRLKEIGAMDKTTLNAQEKKALKQELRSTKKQLREINRGVYLSVGSIIIIILLLILLL